MVKTKSVEQVKDLEDLSFRLSCATNNLLAVHSAMAEGKCRAEDFSDALYSCYIVIEGYSKELEEAVNQAYHKAREDVKNGKTD